MTMLKQLDPRIMRQIENLVNVYNIQTGALFKRMFDKSGSFQREGLDKTRHNGYPWTLVPHPHLNAFRVTRSGFEFLSGCTDPGLLDSATVFDPNGTIITEIGLNKEGIEGYPRSVCQHVFTPSSPFLNKDESTGASVKFWLRYPNDVVHVKDYEPWIIERRYKTLGDFAVAGIGCYGIDGRLIEGGIGIRQGNLVNWEDSGKTLHATLHEMENRLIVSDVHVDRRGVEWEPATKEDAMRFGFEYSHEAEQDLYGRYEVGFKAFGKEVCRTIPRKIDPVLELNGVLRRITKDV